MIDREDARRRCPWVGTDPLMVAYHDQEWGVPCHDDADLFERLLLEGFQAGLSRATILRKRELLWTQSLGGAPAVDRPRRLQ